MLQVSQPAVKRYDLNFVLAQLASKVSSHSSISGAGVEHACRAETGASEEPFQEPQAARNTSQPAVNSPEIIEAGLDVVLVAAPFVEQFDARDPFHKREGPKGRSIKAQGASPISVNLIPQTVWLVLSVSVLPAPKGAAP